MAISKAKAYAAYEKTESPKMKKAEMKKPEGKKEKARETASGMAMLSQGKKTTKSGMHSMNGKMMKNSAMSKSTPKKMGKKK